MAPYCSIYFKLISLACQALSQLGTISFLVLQVPSLAGISCWHPFVFHCQYQINSHLQDSLSSSFLLSTMQILQFLGEAKKKKKNIFPTRSLPKFTPGHRDLSITWNTSRMSELLLPRTLSVQHGEKSCLLTSQWTPWEQR